MLDIDNDEKVKNKKSCEESVQIWARVVGFYRPVNDWNKGKRDEFKDRVNFEIEI